MDRDSFLANLARLESNFAALKPELEVTVWDPAVGVEGYVVVWSTLPAVGGPLGRCGKGGTRITPAVSLEEVGMLARIMSLKNAAAGLPLGGAKSGLRADPTAPGFERKYRRFVQMVAPLLIERGGIFGGFGFDIGGQPIHAEWACDELKTLRCFTGKSVDKGGTDYDREGIAGLGVAIAAVVAVKSKRGPSSLLPPAAIQGIGAMGAGVFRYYREAGGSVMAISDPRIGGTVLLTKTLEEAVAPALVNLDPSAVSGILDQAGAQRLPLGDILFVETEMLFPCAVQDVITVHNQRDIRAAWVVEGANNPSSPAARTALWERGVCVIPDFIANPGGIIAAFVEMSSHITPEENSRTRANVTSAKALTREKIHHTVERMLKEATALEVEPVIVGRYYALQAVLGETGSLLT
jgi:glutamate dehydrogenase (NAD(P)+)